MQPNQNQPTEQTNTVGPPQQTVSNQNTASPPPTNSSGVISGQMQANPMPGDHKSYDKNMVMILVIGVLAAVLLLGGIGVGTYFVLKEPETTINLASTDTPNSEPSNKKATEKTNLQPAKTAPSPADTERMNEINAIHTHVEAYYSQTGMYPTLAELSDTDFRQTYLNGLNEAVLTDPAGTELISSSANNARYGYAAPKSSSCPSGRVSVCNVYVLTAVLSNGQSYTKKSLN